MEKDEIFGIDGLREVANIGCGHAATALSGLINRKVLMTVPEVLIGKIEDIFKKVVDREDEDAVGILLYFIGDLTGLTLLLLSKNEALTLLSILIGEKITEIKEHEESALKEVGNIITGAYMTALSDFLGLLALPTVPFLKNDNVKVIILDAFLQIEAEKGFALCIKSVLKIENGIEVKATFFFLPDEHAIGTIQEKLKSFFE
ncbi:MAG: chemotaxis protein CheC [Candidatus Hydrothermales bacterium]